VTVALRCTGLRVWYGGVEVLHGVDLAVPTGAVTALVGPNGAGKSTLLGWCAAAVGTATAMGRLDLAGAEATSWPTARLAAAGLRLVPSGPNIFPGLTVLENLRATGDPAAALELFPELRPLAAQRGATLSGGERQLLAVASALTGDWRVLLVDEPVQGIANALAARVYRELGRAATGDRAVLVTDPLPGRALRVADFVWQLDRGRVVFAGEAAELAGKRDR
jgi:branched-chain amino acid transport system ATP-binding protein